MDWSGVKIFYVRLEKSLVDSLSEPYYNSARSVPAEVRWGNILLEIVLRTIITPTSPEHGASDHGQVLGAGSLVK